MSAIPCPGLAPAPVAGHPSARVCVNCGRPVATYGGRDEHRRGRVKGRDYGPSHWQRRTERRAEGRRAALRLRAVDLAGDVCECGEPADPKLHSPLPRIDRRTWKSRKGLLEGVGWDAARARNANGGARTARQRRAFGSIRGA